MTLLKHAKLLLCASMVIISSGKAQGSELYPDLPCGHYVGQGKVGLSQSGDFLLTIRAGTFSPRELILLGGDNIEKVKAVNASASVIFYVPRLIKSDIPPYVFFKGFSANAKQEDRDFIRLTRKAACGEKSQYLRAKR